MIFQCTFQRDSVRLLEYSSSYCTYSWPRIHTLRHQNRTRDNVCISVQTDNIHSLEDSHVFTRIGLVFIVA